jgi:hypothetical protein
MVQDYKRRWEFQAKRFAILFSIANAFVHRLGVQNVLLKSVSLRLG